MVICDSATLAHLCADLKAQGTFVLDTEFHREQTFYPCLYLVQLAGKDSCVIVDPLADVDLRPLLDLLFDPSVRKVVHAGRQDFELFYARTGRAPANVFDTQIAAALAGLGEEVGYANLVEKVLGVSLPKGETRTDWSRRPLTPAQLEYALNDVRYLESLRAKLEEMLRDLGRLEWLPAECAWYENPASYETDPRAQSLKFRGARNLSVPALGALRELAAWREEDAIRRDVPRQRVLPDDMLVEIARRLPRTLADLRQLRGLHPSEAERSGNAILQAVERGRSAPAVDLPAFALSRSDDPDRALLVDFLTHVVGVRAREARIAASYLATRADLSRLVDAYVESGGFGDAGSVDRPAGAAGAAESIPVLQGWRREVVGEHLLRALRGKIDLGIDPVRKTMTLREPR